ARASKQQNDRKPDDERRRDDRQERQYAQRLLVTKSRAHREEGEGEADRGSTGADENRQEHRIPGDPAADAAGDAAETPDGGAEQLFDQQLRRPGARVVLQGARKHGEDREEYE